MKKKNENLVKKYPFLLPKNVYTGKVPNDYDYSYTLLDSMPAGWRNKFGEQMCEDIKNVLIKTNSLDDFVIYDIKEKFGTLRISSNFTTDELEDVFRKYEDLSMMVCHCGKPTKYITKFWLYYVCEECAKDFNNEIDELTEEDIPVRQILYSGNPHSKIVHSHYEKEMRKQWAKPSK